MGDLDREASENAWKSPPGGFPGRMPDLFHSLRADCRPRSGPLWPELGPLFTAINQLFGDHSAELEAHKVTPEGWRIGLPWRQLPYRYRLRVRLAELSAGELRDQLAASIAEDWEVQAFRGGGKHRHPVWRLGRRTSPNFDVVSLALATRHIREEQRRELYHVTTAFFKAAVRGTEVAGGYGELIRSPCADIYEWARAGDSFERWLAFTLDRDERESGGLAIAGPREIMLLTEAQLARLGGREALLQRAAAAGLTTGSAEPAPPARFRPWLDVWFHELPLGVLLILESPDIGAWDRSRGSSTGLMEPGPAAWWMLDELHSAGLLAYASPGRLARYRERCDREFREAQERVRQGALQKRDRKHRPVSPQARWAHLLANPPRCITGSAAATQDPPPGMRRADNMIWFELQTGNLSGAMPVYGRRGEEPATLFDPVLVGSLKPERAALLFDRRIHGWDGEFSEKAPVSARPLGRLAQLVCPKCGARLFHVWAGFEHDETDEGLETPELQARRQDFFSWFWLVAECAGCRWADTVVDVECA